MSLHAQLSPEAEARFQAQKRNSAVTSVIIALLSLGLVVLILLFIFLPALKLHSEPIVTYNASLEQDEDLDEKRVTDQIKRQPSAPSSAMAKVIASTTPSPTAIPVPEVQVPDPSTDFGSGDDFGAGWGDGGDGAGAGAFGNIPAQMRKRCSKEDRLQRLKENGGTPECEDAVVATLDWLKQTQNKDGSWCSQKRVGMTGLALLTYLGHCETPLSEKYGQTVQAAIVYLVDKANSNKGKLADDFKDDHWPYEHAIGCYAIAEAYTFCKQIKVNIPGLHDAVRDTGQWILDNQSELGSWDYSYAESQVKGGRASGGDNSIGCWQLQALKACKVTGIEFRNMTTVVRKALDYIEQCQSNTGAISYGANIIGAGPTYSTLAGAGALVFQMWDKSSHSVPRNGCRYVAKEVPFKWNTTDCNLYALYYNAQAMINYGGKTWENYNAMFLPEILGNQNKDGSFKDVGGGDKPNAMVAAFQGGGGMALHYRTCLAALTLEVYYRFLPGTGQKTK